jgi:hypothetical protein
LVVSCEIGEDSWDFYSQELEGVWQLLDSDWLNEVRSSLVAEVRQLVVRPLTEDEEIAAVDSCYAEGCRLLESSTMQVRLQVGSVQIIALLLEDNTVDVALVDEDVVAAGSVFDSRIQLGDLDRKIIAEWISKQASWLEQFAR